MSRRTGGRLGASGAASGFAHWSTGRSDEEARADRQDDCTVLHHLTFHAQRWEVNTVLFAPGRPSGAAMNEELAERVPHLFARPVETRIAMTISIDEMEEIFVRIRFFSA